MPYANTLLPEVQQRKQQRDNALNEVHRDINVPFITRGVVKEIDVNGGELDKSNPRNSLIVRVFNLKTDDKDVICYPLFSGHLMLPIKLEEEVWVFFENISNVGHGYWISRVPELHQTDDVNYVSWKDKKKTKHVTGTIDKIEKKNIDNLDIDESQFTGRNTETNNTVERATNQEASKQTDSDVFFKKEIVPLFRKRAADFVIQGSNNTLISMSTDRVSSIDTQRDKNSAGTIDIVVGRGTKDVTRPNLTSAGVRDRQNLKNTEGDVSFADDAARITISMNTDPDDNFKTTTQGSVNEKKTSAIIQKGDAIRIIARSSVKIETQDKSSIVIKPNGEIIIKGSKIRVGSDAANEQLVLGNTFVAAMNNFLTVLNSGNVGNLGAPIPGITAAVTALQNDLKRILSNNNFTE